MKKKKKKVLLTSGSVQEAMILETSGKTSPLVSMFLKLFFFSSCIILDSKEVEQGNVSALYLICFGSPLCPCEHQKQW